MGISSAAYYLATTANDAVIILYYIYIYIYIIIIVFFMATYFIKPMAST